MRAHDSAFTKAYGFVVTMWLAIKTVRGLDDPSVGYIAPRASV